MPLTTTLAKAREEFDEKIPCSRSCDRNGTVANGDSEPEQCQFCYEVRLPARELLESQLRALHAALVAELLEKGPRDRETGNYDEVWKEYVAQGLNKANANWRTIIKEVGGIEVL